MSDNTRNRNLKVTNEASQPQNFKILDSMFQCYYSETKTFILKVMFITLYPGLNKLRAWWRTCTQRARKEVTACTKLRARKPIKTPLGRTPMLSKIVSYFCVWEQLIFGTIKFIISFNWEAVVKCSYI